MRAVLVAAGTGGHINPAITIANKIIEEEKDSEILFIGTYTGIENDLVPRAGYDLKQVEAYGLIKEISFSNFRNLFKTFLSYFDAKKILKEYNPDVVIGTGGYVNVPVLLAAHSLKIPTILHESNAFPGRAVKLFNKKANKILLGFEKSKDYFKYKNNLITVGNPINMKKNQFTKLEKADIFKKAGLKKNLPTILVTGGSQGALTINRTLVDIIKNKELKDYQIIWATGPQQYDEVKESLREDNIDINNIKNIRIESYIYNMDEILSITDLMICRSGAMTVTEVMMLRKTCNFCSISIIWCK